MVESWSDKQTGTPIQKYEYPSPPPLLHNIFFANRKENGSANRDGCDFIFPYQNIPQCLKSNVPFDFGCWLSSMFHKWADMQCFICALNCILYLQYRWNRMWIVNSHQIIFIKVKICCNNMPRKAITSVRADFFPSLNDNSDHDNGASSKNLIQHFRSIISILVSNIQYTIGCTFLWISQHLYTHCTFYLILFYCTVYSVQTTHHTHYLFPVMETFSTER